MIDVLFGSSLFPFGLKKNAPLSAKPVELIDEKAPEVGLQRLVNVADLDALFQYLVPIDVRKQLRYGRRKLRGYARKFRTFARGCQKLLEILIEKIDGASAAYLYPQREPSGTSQTWYRGR